MCDSFPFDFEGGMWNLIVLATDLIIAFILFLLETNGGLKFIKIR